MTRSKFFSDDHFNRNMGLLLMFMVILIVIVVGFGSYTNNVEYDEKMAEWQALDKNELREWLSNNHDELSYNKAENKYKYGNFGE